MKKVIHRGSMYEINASDFGGLDAVRRNLEAAGWINAGQDTYEKIVEGSWRRVVVAA